MPAPLTLREAQDREAGQLVLSIFPGIGMLDAAFELEGFTVVRGPDPLWGGDVRRFHPPAGRFDGVIGGDPCQSHSALANLVRAKGLEPSFPDLSPEYQRVIEETRPAWFLRENVPGAPDIKPDGYDVRTFVLDNSTLDSGDGWGNEQMRKRRFWFGVRQWSHLFTQRLTSARVYPLTVCSDCGQESPCDQAAGPTVPELRQWIDFALRELPEATPAVAGDARSVPVAIGGSGRRKVTAVGGHDGTADAINGYRKARKAAPVTGRPEGAVGAPGIDYSPPRRDLKEMLRLQGFPEDWIGHQPWTMSAMRKMVGNGVPLPMGRQLAKAIRTWLEKEAPA